MDDFNPWDEATNQREANEFIAHNVDLIQQLYSEAVLVAREFDIRISFTLELPENAQGGHNSPLGVWWNPSSQYC